MGEDASASRARTPVVVLVGRPNAGKSSLYNRLTGGNARVGNYPGVTVDILEALVDLPGGRAAKVVDLPGLYSISATIDPATDEGIARRFLENARRDGQPMLVIQVVDATQLALGLRLTRELLGQLGPLLLVATQADILAAEGRSLDTKELEDALGVSAVAINARSDAVRDVVLGRIATCLDRLDAVPPLREASEGTFDPDELATRVICERSAAVSRGRRNLTARADALLLHPLAGLAIFASVLTVLFASVYLVADPVSQLLDAASRVLAGWIVAGFGEGLVSSFLVDGVLGGAGTVLTFLPQVVILTVAMELLEATGYLSRGAFLVDRLLSVARLGGRAFIPLLTGHACAVPAIYATRILRDPRERLTTILILPLMTCSARIPVYGLLIAAFFAGSSAWTKSAVFVLLYFAGILFGLLAALAFRRTVTKGKSLPMATELPAYRSPELRVLVSSIKRATSRFLREVGTTILAAAMVLWALLNIPLPGRPAKVENDPGANLSHSIAGGVGRALEPVTAPLGFDWRINVGLIASFGARELMVGTLGIINGIEGALDDPSPLASQLRSAKTEDGRPRYRTRTALALMAFFVLACQCLSTVAAVRRETRSWRWPAFVLGYTYALAYLAALVVNQGLRWMGG
ncbi:MAG: ferrous iron transporter B [Deltaproteobacteria bacterium]|nr:ferrous iron transporter B [Deltaproteobacteria bacterium]